MTFGEQDDYRPLWSPDGKRILFTRYRGDGKVAVCLLGAEGGKVASMTVLPDEIQAGGMRYQWSQDGRTIALLLNRSLPTGVKPLLHLLDVATKKVRKEIRDVSDCAWSPDSRKLYLSREVGKDAILDVKKGSLSVVADRIWNPTWLDNRHLLGTIRREQGFAAGDSKGLRVIGLDGKEHWQIPIKQIGGGSDNAMEFNAESVRWQRMGNNNRSVLVESGWHMSDGQHYACYSLDYKTGRYRFLRDGMMLGLSPGRSMVAVAAHEWGGPYKRGGARVGALEVINLKTGKSWAVTRALVSIGGGDWRR